MHVKVSASLPRAGLDFLAKQEGQVTLAAPGTPSRGERRPTKGDGVVPSQFS